MKLAIVVEAIPPYCGGGEQVAWIHASELAKRHEVTVITFGDSYSQARRDGVNVCFMPRRKRNLLAYATLDQPLLRRCIQQISPDIIHSHMPHILSACIPAAGRLMVSTIHDGVPEDELVELNYLSRAEWLKFKLIRRANVSRSDLITCVSRFSRDVMRRLYPAHAGKFSYIPNPIYERYFSPGGREPGNYVLNFGRQIPLKMNALVETARLMPDTEFVFVGTGEMVRDHGLPNVQFVGFSDAVERYIDAAGVCVFPSLSENFPLVGLEAMARGRPVIATRRGFGEYITHMKDGFLLDSVSPVEIKLAIERLMGDAELRAALAEEGRRTAQKYRPELIVKRYEALYASAMGERSPGSG